MSLKVRALGALALLAASAAAAADEVRLTNGGSLRGDARRVGDEVVVATLHGEVRLPAADVAEIVEGPTRADAYRARLAETDRTDAPALVALGDWCREAGLSREARSHFREALAADPDHAVARARLGYLRHDGRWVTEDEYHVARGFVKVEGRWVPREEARRRDAERIARKAQLDHERTVRTCLAKLASRKRKTRLEGRLALQEYAESIGDPGLAAFASRAAEYYNAAWRAVKTELEARVKAEVRATHTSLKRPIPTLTTSLGAGSTPVTIQLPELSVVRVQTTVLVPASIELDEE